VATPPSVLGLTPAKELIEAADAAVEGGNLDRAGGLYDRLLREYPISPEADEARRALKIIKARENQRERSVAPAAPASSPGTQWSGSQDQVAPEPGHPKDPVVMRQEPYSTRTSERLRLTTWEKLDFGVTAFLYGMSVGFSFALSSSTSSTADVTTPVALGALAYTVGAVVYLKTAEPDRGDLPLVLAVTSYIPTTTLLVANLAFDHPDGKKVAGAVAGAGLLSVPIAIALTRNLDLDPGDTQLVRDAGFWGLVLGTTGTLGFGGTTQTYPGSIDTYYQSPSSKAVSGFALAGLYGGLGLGVLAASQSEVSLERVRVSTWGGYGGALLGALLGGSADNGDRGVYRGLTVGALVGLVVTFVASSGLDGIPPENPVVSAAMRLSPSLMSSPGPAGRLTTAFGFGGVLP
jgi:hypothetical protein